VCLVYQVLHSGRYNDARYNHKEAFEWMEGLRKAGRFYVTPGGSNDDWYWMYAAVHARERGLLVSAAAAAAAAGVAGMVVRGC
jgi:proteinaceous RNase P